MDHSLTKNTTYEHRFLKPAALFIGTLGMLFAGINWQIGIAAWVAPVFLLYYTRHTKVKGFFLLFIFLFFAGALQTDSNKFNIFVLYIINGLILAVAFTSIYIIDRLLHKRSNRFYTTLIFPSVLTLFEFVFTSKLGTMGMVAHTQYHFKAFIQLASLTGIYSITFIIAWLASIVNWLYDNKFSPKSIIKGSYIYGSIFIAIIIFGFINLSYSTKGFQKVKVVTISCDIDLHKIFLNEQETFEEYIKNPETKIPSGIFADQSAINKMVDRTKDAADQGAKIIVWNEDALILSSNQAEALLSQIKIIAHANNAYILPAFLVESHEGEKPFDNKCILITPDGNIGWEYLKSHLDPGGELQIVNAGNSVIPFIDTEYGRIGSVICYDLDFPTFIRQAGKNNIDIMLVPSYDWKGITPLHPRMACFEALQNGFSLIRANGAGLNIITDSHGSILSEMNTFNSDYKILMGEIPLKANTTVYSKIGNILVFFAFIFIALISVLRIFNNKITQ
ncbi:MAG: hypothetical protein JW833_01260 [Prolixibacteraceae bacterium]|nr:hypothetical protein [Prolixibacteraceae bacterium]